MATQTESLKGKHQLFVKRETDGDSRYKNLNLNQNQKSLNVFPVQSYNNSTANNDIDFDDKGKENLQAWNSTDVNSKIWHPLNLNIEAKKWTKKNYSASNSANNSTLSLYIAAYENSIETADSFKDEHQNSVLIKKCKNVKQILTDSFVFLNLFEFPRQQEGDQIADPKIMQFKANQRLNTFSESPSPSDFSTSESEENPKVSDSVLGFNSAPILPFGGLTITGVKEGNEYKYDSSQISFAYCDTLIELYRAGEDVLFDDYMMPDGDSGPASGYGFFDGQLINNLNERGIVTMRPIQVASFQATFFNNFLALQASDFLGISSTGSGKTHAFLVPIVQKCLNHLDGDDESDTSEDKNDPKRTPFALIFAHSNTLVDEIYQKTLELVNGTDIIVKKIVGQQDFITDSNFDIAVCSVGRFANHFGRNVCKVEVDLSGLKYVVIDEADIMAQNDEFYQLFMEMKEKSKFVTMLFSATYNTAVLDFIDTNNYYGFLYGEQNAVPSTIKQRFYEVNTRNITKIVGIINGDTPDPKYEPDEKLHPFDLLYLYIKKINKNEGSKKRFLVFVKRTCVADFIAQKLSVYGIDAISIYSDRKDRDAVEKRNRLIGKFVNGDVHVLVATQLISRGIDIEIDFVINYDLPLTYFDYIHRCGRTGRNQKSGTAISFIDFENPADYSPRVLQKIVLNCKEPLPAFFIDFAESAKRLNEIEMEERDEQANLHL
uniref:ATP-dependent RNA helicase n=1 Tax=Panagrolaimus sp. PS1159 TaxID=55785 RepID=A0AC35GKQ6_9BILA